MNKFKVGDRIRFIDWKAEPHPRRTGWLNKIAVVINLESPLGHGYSGVRDRVEIKWEHEPRQWTTILRECRFELVEEPKLKFSRIKKHTRGGYPVTDIYDTGSKDRPFTGKVRMPDGAVRNLAFSPSGHFYKNMEQDIDLVERQ